jgi:hypothetical protein
MFFGIFWGEPGGIPGFSRFFAGFAWFFLIFWYIKNVWFEIEEHKPCHEDMSFFSGFPCLFFFDFFVYNNIHKGACYGQSNV